MKYITDERVNELEKLTWGTTSVDIPGTDACALIKELLWLRGHVAELTDAVVMAAALCGGQIEKPSEQGYAVEVLHDLAFQLVEDNPRLKGAYPIDAE